jgi:ABC-type lipoprotein export system ATPase subunit
MTEKIEIAHALMRDAEVLLPHDPAPALDARSGHEVFQCFRALSRAKTAI